MTDITAKKYQQRRRKAGVVALEKMLMKYTESKDVPKVWKAAYGKIVDAVLMACDIEEDKICDELADKMRGK